MKQLLQKTVIGFKTHNVSSLLCGLALAVPCTVAWATDGYFPHGYGMKAKGMGGAAVARTDDAFAGANNPASAAWAGNRVEGGLEWFSPKRGAARTGSPMGAMDTNISSGQASFLIPEFGYNAAISDRLAVGVTVYGNGGMNTDYAGGNIMCQNPTTGLPYAANSLCGVGGLGVDLMQLVVAPTLAYKISDQHSLGVSPLLVYQQFQANGLQAFAPMSIAPNQLTNNGNDSSTGVGVRLGYLGRVSDRLTVGVSYSPKVRMKKLDLYAGLFAGGGAMDIPDNTSVGLSFVATPSVQLALDMQRIGYDRVAAVGNPGSNLMACAGGAVTSCLGGPNGPGFGWSAVSVVKLGAQWAVTPAWTLRAGYNRSSNPIAAKDVTFNIIAPGVITHHLTLGGTYRVAPNAEFTWAYMYAPRQSVTGASMFNGLFPGVNATETIHMSQQSLGVQMGWSF
jgi:long-chain fatty acid transport protein